MTKLSTKNADLTPPNRGGDFVTSVMRPGNHKLKIHNVIFKLDPKFGDKIQLFVEGEPVGANFQGLPVDKNNPNGPTYAGQVGYISLDRWGFKDWTNGTITIDRNEEIFRAIGLLCRGVGVKLLEWWDSVDGKFETVDELVNAFINDRPFDDVWFYTCVAGREYLNGTYLNYELFFPRESRTLGVPYSLNKDRVIKYFASEHIIRLSADKKAATTTESKTEQTTEPAKPANLSQAEKDFIAEGERVKKEKEAASAQTNAEFLKELNETNPVDDSAKDIVTGDNQDKLPWE